MVDEPRQYTISDAWEDAARWMDAWRADHPNDERDDGDIYLSEDYCPDSPYWLKAWRN